LPIEAIKTKASQWLSKIGIDFAQGDKRANLVRRAATKRTGIFEAFPLN
jgi:hypothetical protein